MKCYSFFFISSYLRNIFNLVINLYLNNLLCYYKFIGDILRVEL